MRALAAIAALLIASPALAQEQVTIALDPSVPIPSPDPQAWWTDEWPDKPAAAAPLGGRRPRRGERPPAVDNGVAPLLYRLWGLAPLQEQLLRGDEMIVEVWARPAQTVRQAMARVTLRSDGRAFVQGRAGFGCCEPEISRRVAFDEEIAAERAAAVRAVLGDAMWSQPRLVELAEDGQTVDPLCVDGVDYDVTLATAGGSRHLHRACIGEEIGSVAPALTAVLAAALGYDPRFDVVFPRGADFAADRRTYEAFTARGGQLRAVKGERPQPAMIPTPPDAQAPVPPEPGS